jgi:hypothetical protein
MSGVTTLRVMLSDLNKLEDVNKTKKGVYLDTKMEWLVVNWVEAAQGVLAQSTYRGETPTFLKSVSERSPYYVETADVVRERVLERLVDVMGPCQPLGLITVFSVKHLLDATRKRRDEAMTVATGVPNTVKNVDTDQPQASGGDDDPDKIVV